MPSRKFLGRALLIAAVLFFLFSQAMLWLKVLAPLADAKWYLDIPHQRQNVTDFFQYYQAGQLALSAELSHKVYDPEVQRQWLNDLIAPLHSDKVFYNQQPPFFYPLLTPLSLLPPNLAYPAWCVLQMAFGMTALFLLSRFGALQAKDRKLFLLGVISCFPAYICLWHGNTSFWLLGWLALYAYCLYAKKDALAGVALALSTFKPQYVFPFLVPALAMRRWRTLIALAIAEACLMGLACLVIGSENVIGYPQIVANAESNPTFIGVKPQLMVSLRGLFGQFLTNKGSLQATAAVMFVSLVPLYMLWRRVLKDGSVQRMRWVWALTFLVGLLVSPHSHVFDAVLLSVAGVLTIDSLSILDNKNHGVWYRIWCIAFLLYPPLSWLANFAIGYEISPIAFFVPFNIVLLIAGVLAYRGISENPSQQSEKSSESTSSTH